MSLPSYFKLSKSVADALRTQHPIVGLESTVITHGLPRPVNLNLAREMEDQIRAGGATPATVALLDGEIWIGLDDAALVKLSNLDDVIKVSRRDFATALLKKSSGGTTVAGTMFAAAQAGIKVFATGGIGGVHREAHLDISTDLPALADTPMIVVCAGAKSILDLAATLEYLETMSVPVVGYKTDKFPAFYSVDSGLRVSVRCDSPEEIVALAKAHWGLGMPSAILVCQPLPEADALSADVIEPAIAQASREVVEKNICGQAVTPFELARVNELTNGVSMKANLTLLKNNAALAAQIAKALAGGRQVV